LIVVAADETVINVVAAAAGALLTESSIAGRSIL